MLRKTVSGIILTMLLVGMLAFSFDIQPARTSPATIVVPDDYPTIQEAINNANDGDDVYVRAGTYFGPILVDKRISLVGQDSDVTIIDGQGSGPVIRVIASNVTIEGFTIQHSGYVHLLDLESNNNKVFRNIMKMAAWQAVYLRNANNNTLKQNTFLQLSASSIHIDNSHNNLVYENVFYNVYAGIWVTRGSHYNRIEKNTITNSMVSIFIDKSFGTSIKDNIITSSGFSGIDLDGSPNSTVIGNTVSNSFFGMRVRSGSNVLRNNNFIENEYNFEVYLWYGKLSDFTSNDIDTSNTVNGKPIYYLINRHNLRIDQENYPDIGYLLLANSSHSTIENLNLRQNVQGIVLAYTNSCIIQNINASCNLVGIWLRNSENNTLIENTVSHNRYYGMWVRNSSGNNIYHNTFLENSESHIENIFSISVNSWDDGYPSGGNYWSDQYHGDCADHYSGPYQNETGGDGIVDTPYVIDESNQDNYPLMEPWTPKPTTPIEALEELIETIETWDLHEGTENGLGSKLEDVIHLLEKGNENGALHKLMDFISYVEALRGKKLTDEQADYLIAEAQRIIDLIKE